MLRFPRASAIARVSRHTRDTSLAAGAGVPDSAPSGMQLKDIVPSWLAQAAADGVITRQELQQAFFQLVRAEIRG